MNTSIAAVDGDDTPTLPTDDYWHALIKEKTAADFLGLTIRTLQLHRQRGGGPRYVRLSARCVRYRRADLRAWADLHVRTSTSDTGGTV